MIPPTATTASLLSNHSLALSVSLITDPIRDGLDAKVRHFSHLVGWSTITVAIGVLLEGIELVHAFNEGRKRKRREKVERVQLTELLQVVPIGIPRRLSRSHSEEPPWVKLVLRIGLILVVIGVVGEWRCGAKLEDAHDAVHEYDLAKLIEADQKAGEAAKSAKTARDEAAAVHREADAIQKRLDTASTQLSRLDEELLVQGPRWRLLDRYGDVFLKALELERFRGQKVTVMDCGNSDNESLALQDMLLNLFGKARWDASFQRWPECPVRLSGANEMYFVSAEPEADVWSGLPPAMWAQQDCGRFNTLHDAFGELCDVLDIKIGITTLAMREKPMPEQDGMQLARNFWGDGRPNGPAELAYKEPGRIFLVVEPRMLTFQKRRNPRTVKTKP